MSSFVMQGWSKESPWEPEKLTTIVTNSVVIETWNESYEYLSVDPSLSDFVYPESCFLRQKGMAFVFLSVGSCSPTFAATMKTSAMEPVTAMM